MNRKVRIYKQTCVPLWFKAKFGEDYAPLSGTDEALARFVAPAFAVGVRLETDDAISIAAPLGLDDVFAMIIRPNPLRPVAKDWDRVVAKSRDRWPELTIIGPRLD